MADVKYILVQPDKVVKSGNTWGIVLPDDKVNQTVIAGQTLGVMKISNGIIRLLDSNGKITERFFVRQGIANIVNDECIVASEDIIAFDDVDVEAVMKCDDDFHKMVAENIKALK